MRVPKRQTALSHVWRAGFHGLVIIWSDQVPGLAFHLKINVIIFSDQVASVKCLHSTLLTGEQSI